MRKFTTRIVAANLTQARKPRPFAGKYPTRVAWVVFRKDGTLVDSYIGKPNRLQVRRLDLLGRRLKGAVAYVCEFDRNGVIWRTASNGRYVSMALFEFYHPWLAVGGSHWSMPRFAQPFYIKRVGGMRFYSNRDPLRREDIITLKQRMTEMGLLKPPAPEDIPF